MKEFVLRSYKYSCNCGYVMKVYIDSGIPMERFKCRKCGSMILRTEM